jgi:hypothetical protein
MTARLLIVTAASLALAGSAPGANGSTLSLRDEGKTFALRRGHDLTLRLTERYMWSALELRGTSVRLTPVEYLVDPGFLEWTITTRARGTTLIAAVGTCAGCATRNFRVTIIVR